MSVQLNTEDEVPLVFSESAAKEANISIFDHRPNAETCSQGVNTLVYFDENDKDINLSEDFCGTDISEQLPLPETFLLRITTAEEGVTCSLSNLCLGKQYAKYCSGDSVKVPFDKPPLCLNVGHYRISGILMGVLFGAIIIKRARWI